MYKGQMPGGSWKLLVIGALRELWKHCWLQAGAQHETQLSARAAGA